MTISSELLLQIAGRARGVIRRGASGLRDHRGSVAVEFAMIGVPLLFTILATLETLLVILATASLSSATSLAARQIRTGQLPATTTTAASFGQIVCSNMSWLNTTCANSIHVNTQVFTSFASITTPNVVTNGAFDASNLQFSVGNAGDIVMVKTYMTWNLATPLLSYAFGGLSNGQIILSASSAFRNEP